MEAGIMLLLVIRDATLVPSTARLAPNSTDKVRALTGSLIVARIDRLNQIMYDII